MLKTLEIKLKKYNNRLIELESMKLNLTEKIEINKDKIKCITCQITSIEKEKILLGYPFLEDLRHNGKERVDLRSKILFLNPTRRNLLDVDDLLQGRVYNDKFESVLTLIAEEEKYIVLDKSNLINSKIQDYLQIHSPDYDVNSKNDLWKLDKLIKLNRRKAYRNTYNNSNNNLEIYHDKDFELFVRARSNLLELKVTINDFEVDVSDTLINVTDKISGLLIIATFIMILILLNNNMGFSVAVVIYLILGVICLNLIYFGCILSYRSKLKDNFYFKFWGVSKNELSKEISLFEDDILDYFNSYYSNRMKDLRVVWNNLLSDKNSILENNKRIEMQLEELRLKIAHTEEIVTTTQVEIDTIKKMEYQKEASYWLSLGGHQFEREISDLLSNIGLSSHTTSGSNDRGIDIILKLDEEVIPIQCKNHAKAVSPGAIRDFQGAVSTLKNGTKSIFISSNGYTIRAQIQAKFSKMLLLDINDIVLLHRNEKKAIEELYDYLNLP